MSIAEFMVRLELAARERDDIRILERGEILEEAPKSHRDRLVHVEANIRLNGTLRKNSVILDALFGLRFIDEEESYFMLEIDRGEMPVERYANAQRIERMICALEEITGGRRSNMFLFTDRSTLVENSPLELEWRSGKRELARLLD